MPTLDWVGKNDAVREAQKIPYRLLEFDAALSCGENFSGNMIIQGDNLHALKSLLPFYRGRVKCIYIDPPYNTGAAFEHYDDNLGHSTWLSMMYPRLELLRDFLADDGSIWISIDDDEAHYLKIICDELFGRNNFVASVIWEKKYSPQNDAKWLSDSHDFILVYALKKNLWRPNLLPRTEEMNARYKNPDNDPRGVWMSGNLSAKSGSDSNFEHIFSNGVKWKPTAGRFSAFSHETLERLERENRIWFGNDGNNVPRLKRFLSDVKQGLVSKTIWLREEVGDNQDGKREVKEFNSENVFATPKPERLIEKILTLATNAGDLVLDSFLGSGTTAAVAHKMNRRYIGIEMGEQAITHVVPRLRKVIDGEQGGISKSVGWTGGGNFNFYRLGEPIFNGAGKLNRAVTFEELAAYIWFKFTGTPYTEKNLPMIGIHNGAAYYLIEKTLTRKILEGLPEYDGAKIIFGSASRIGAEDLKSLNITFRQIPKDVR